MVFSCTGNTVFTNLSLDYSNDNQLYATFIASDTWDTDTEVKVKATIGGETVVKEKFDICDYISNNSCGQQGEVKLDLSSFLPAGATSAAMTTVITAADIEIKAKPNGSYETCTKGSFLVAHQMFNGSSGNTSKAVGFAAGTIALAGLATAYVVKKKRSKRSETEPTLKQSIFGGDMA